MDYLLYINKRDMALNKSKMADLEAEEGDDVVTDDDLDASRELRIHRPVPRRPLCRSVSVESSFLRQRPQLLARPAFRPGSPVHAAPASSGPAPDPLCSSLPTSLSRSAMRSLSTTSPPSSSYHRKIRRSISTDSGLGLEVIGALRQFKVGYAPEYSDILSTLYTIFNVLTFKYKTRNV